MKNKLILKIITLVVLIVIFCWLLPKCNTITIEDFYLWLFTIIMDVILIIIFIVWISDTLSK